MSMKGRFNVIINESGGGINHMRIYIVLVF